MLWAITLFIIGAPSYTVISYLAKYLKDPKTAFNKLYIFTSLLSMFLIIMLSPTFLVPGILPFEVAGTAGFIFVIVGCFSLSFTGNYLLNLPITFLLKELSAANISVMAGLKPKPRYLIYLFALIGLLALIGGATVNALVQYEASIHTEGTIAGIGVNIYGNAALSQPLSTLSWGIPHPGDVVYRTIWVLNTGNMPVTLGMYTDDWVPPSAQDFILISWDYHNTEIIPNESVQIDLILTVSPQISGITNFGFDITIVASG